MKEDHQKGNVDNEAEETLSEPDAGISVEEDTNKIHEAADVFYHLIIFLEANNVKIEDVMMELNKRKKWAMKMIMFSQKF